MIEMLSLGAESAQTTRRESQVAVALEIDAV